MKPISIVRICQPHEVCELIALSNAIIEWLSLHGKQDYFEKVDEMDVREAMQDPSKVFISRDEKGKIQGFLLLQKPSGEEEGTYKKEFPSLRDGEALIVNTYGVAPEKQGKKVGSNLLRAAYDYAIENGYTQFIGTIHPKNGASENMLRHVSHNLVKGKAFTHHTNDGRDLLRQRFLQEL